jgi:hypothetical protein
MALQNEETSVFRTGPSVNLRGLMCREAFMEVTITPEEMELLLEILEEHHRELLREIARTSHHEFKLVLRKKEKLLESVLLRLRAAQLVYA